MSEKRLNFKEAGKQVLIQGGYMAGTAGFIEGIHAATEVDDMLAGKAFETVFDYTNLDTYAALLVGSLIARLGLFVFRSTAYIQGWADKQDGYSITPPKF